MSARQAKDQASRAPDDTVDRRTKTYNVVGWAIVAAVAIVVLVGAAGFTGPGVLGTGEAFFILGTTALILVGGVVGLYLSMRNTLRAVQEQQAQIDRMQDRERRDGLSDQGARDTAQEFDIEGLEARLAEQNETMVARLEQRVEDLEEELTVTRSQTQNRIGSLEAELSDRLAVGAAGSGETETAPKASPFGDVHPVEDVEGIGETYRQELEDLGIEDTRQLWMADPDEISHALDVPRKTVDKWHDMIELIALNHVGPQYAELLVRTGVRSIDELASESPELLADRVQAAEERLENRIQGNKITPKVAKRWIQAAKDHEFTPLESEAP